MSCLSVSLIIFFFFDRLTVCYAQRYFLLAEIEMKRGVGTGREYVSCYGVFLLQMTSVILRKLISLDLRVLGITSLCTFEFT